MDTLFRVPPRAGPELYRSWTLAAPVATHWRPATCAESDCDAYLHGWVTTLDPVANAAAVAYLRGDRTREHTEETGPDGLIRFTFGPGQRCFRADTHRVPLERPPLHVIREGDWRGNPRRIPASTVSRSEWLDRFATHQDQLAAAAAG